MEHTQQVIFRLESPQRTSMAKPCRSFRTRGRRNHAIHFGDPIQPNAMLFQHQDSTITTRTSTARCQNSTNRQTPRQHPGLYRATGIAEHVISPATLLQGLHLREPLELCWQVLQEKMASAGKRLSNAGHPDEPHRR